MAKTMPLLIRYIMTRLFKKTYKEKFKEKTRYDFTPVKEYNSFKEKKCIDQKFAFKSKIFWKKIKAYHYTNDIKVTSISLDFLMAKKTEYAKYCYRSIDNAGKHE